MSSYKLSLDAEKDLQDIAHYTLNAWGKKIFQQYQSGLKKQFKAIAKKEVPRKTFSKQFPELFVSKYRYHFIFYILSTDQTPIIIGVIHEQRDIVSHLAERLS